MLYKVKIKPKSMYKTELKSSTLFGALMCIIAHLFGDKYVTDICEGVKEFVVSDAFPSGYLPNQNDSNTIINEDNNVISRSSNHKQAVTYKCQINRDTGCTDSYRNDIANYYDGIFDIYLLTDSFNKSEISKIFETLFKLGIGAGRSVGYGDFELIDIEENVNLNLLEQGEIPTGYMLLSDYIPNDNDSIDGNYTIRLINSKTSDGKDRGTYAIINSGSKFKGILSGKTVGRILKDEKTGTYLSGKALIIPIKV